MTTKQEFGLYFTWSGYAAGIVGMIFASRHLAILIAASAALVLVFLGRQLEKP